VIFKKLFANKPDEVVLNRFREKPSSVHSLEAIGATHNKTENNFVLDDLSFPPSCSSVNTCRPYFFENVICIFPHSAEVNIDIVLHLAEGKRIFWLLRPEVDQK
jgi:hypothetical protein